MSLLSTIYNFQDRCDSDEEVLQGEPGGEDRIPKGRGPGYQEAPLVPGGSIPTNEVARFIIGWVILNKKN